MKGGGGGLISLAQICGGQPNQRRPPPSPQPPSRPRAVFVYEVVEPLRGLGGGLTRDDSSLNALPFKSSLMAA